MRGAIPSPDAAMRLKQYGLVKLLGWRGYQEIPAHIANDFAAIIEEETLQQADEMNRVQNEADKIRRR